jgi:hypothetical protein
MPDRLRPALLQAGLAVLVLAVAGVLAGAVWEWVWTPPTGVVVDHEWVALDESSLRGQFSGTAWYVIVGAVAGLVGGAVAALFLDRVPLATLVGVVVGSVLGALLMYRVGIALGPGDPVHAAATADEGAHLPARLAVSGHSAWIALPAGALVALTLVFLGLSAVHRSDVGDADPVTRD